MEGDISVPVSSQNADNDLSTLDEPVKDTIVSETFCYGWTMHIFCVQIFCVDNCNEEKNSECTSVV